MEAELEEEFEGLDKHEITFVAAPEKVFKESDERGEEVVVVKCAVVAKVTVPSM